MYELEFEYDENNPQTFAKANKAKPILFIIMFISVILVMLNITRKIIFIRFTELTTGAIEKSSDFSKIMTILRNILIFSHPSPFLFGKQLFFQNISVTGGK